MIHDEIMIEVQEEALEQAAIEMSEIMTAEDVLGLPFFNDAKVGTSYGNWRNMASNKAIDLTRIFYTKSRSNCKIAPDHILAAIHIMLWQN